MQNFSPRHINPRFIDWNLLNVKIYRNKALKVDKTLLQSKTTDVRVIEKVLLPSPRLRGRANRKTTRRRVITLRAQDATN